MIRWLQISSIQSNYNPFISLHFAFVFFFCFVFRNEDDWTYKIPVSKVLLFCCDTWHCSKLWINELQWAQKHWCCSRNRGCELYFKTNKRLIQVVRIGLISPQGWEFQSCLQCEDVVGGSFVNTFWWDMSWPRQVLGTQLKFFLNNMGKKDCDIFAVYFLWYWNVNVSCLNI